MLQTIRLKSLVAVAGALLVLRGVPGHRVLGVATCSQETAVVVVMVVQVVRAAVPVAIQKPRMRRSHRARHSQYLWVRAVAQEGARAETHTLVDQVASHQSRAQRVERLVRQVVLVQVLPAAAWAAV